MRAAPMPYFTLARIDAASAAELEAMELRVLSASTLDEVLGSPTPGSS
ncbi:MAG: hypothetical protein IPM54_06445 [Polyangiaceae bacterium]|nr:hypothetical protein [Polyangiaceae bacterium]